MNNQLVISGAEKKIINKLLNSVMRNEYDIVNRTYFTPRLKRLTKDNRDRIEDILLHFDFISTKQSESRNGVLLTYWVFNHANITKYLKYIDNNIFEVEERSKYAIAFIMRYLKKRATVNQNSVLQQVYKYDVLIKELLLIRQYLIDNNKITIATSINTNGKKSTVWSIKV